MSWIAGKSLHWPGKVDQDLLCATIATPSRFNLPLFLPVTIPFHLSIPISFDPLFAFLQISTEAYSYWQIFAIHLPVPKGLPWPPHQRANSLCWWKLLCNWHKAASFGKMLVKPAPIRNRLQALLEYICIDCIWTLMLPHEGQGFSEVEQAWSASLHTCGSGHGLFKLANGENTQSIKICHNNFPRFYNLICIILLLLKFWWALKFWSEIQRKFQGCPQGDRSDPFQ